MLIYVRIVEYATREQAQQAVNTLSNQTLMGRLVYVREVRIDRRLVNCVHADTICRIVRPSHVLPVLQEEVTVETSVVDHAEASRATLVAHHTWVVAWVITWAAWADHQEAVVVRFTSTTFVSLTQLSSPNTPLLRDMLTITKASIHCWMAGSEGLVPSGWYVSFSLLLT